MCLAMCNSSRPCTVSSSVCANKYKFYSFTIYNSLKSCCNNCKKLKWLRAGTITSHPMLLTLAGTGILLAAEASQEEAVIYSSKEDFLDAQYRHTGHGCGGTHR